MTIVLELIVSIAGYYCLRAFGIGVIWSLAIPGIVVGLIALGSTVRRRKIDAMGILVLLELAATLGLSFTTGDVRIAACRQPLYVLIGGAFCLCTLLAARPLTATFIGSAATFGDPVRARAFEMAWQESPDYRRAQRVMTTAVGSIMVVDSVLRILVIYVFPATRIDLSLLLSNGAGIVMFVLIGFVARALVMPARRIVLDYVEQLKAEAAE
ncbi:MULTISPECIES: VC0807 family protein [unclassified Streptomyces]|uniref:VC0807 family protein n=1 Tax=unclassified Streptomyces TaxID=2593676 RepID=UPI000367B737|nr:MULTISPECIES: VC0807 family protein [unclassified Streptomyces]MYT32519.1 hypothetical protein [Streptomyces sp. SID8354]